MKDWVEFDEPIRRVVSMSIDVFVTSLLADVAIDGAQAAAGAAAMRMFMEAELAGARARVGDDAVNEAIASAQPLMAAIGAGPALNEAVNDAIVVAGEAACAVLGVGEEGTDATAWHGLAEAQRRVICCGLAMERNRRALDNAKNQITSAAQKTLSVEMVSTIEDLSGGGGASTRGFNVGYNASVIVSETIIEAFDSALTLLMSASGAEEKAA
jgi:hypothetical protein